MTKSRVNYTVLDTEMIGYLSGPDTESAHARRPGVLLIHEGGGQDDNVRNRADRLAQYGYVAFAMDYLGGGKQHPPEVVQARIGAFSKDPALVRAIALAGYEILASQGAVDQDRVAAIGFCFGGAMALELARSDVPLRAAVGFHPAFAAPRVSDSAAIEASVLMFSGADDPIVSDEDRSRFTSEMRDAKVSDWRLEVFGGVGHSFTNPSIGARGLPGFVYDERADRRSWSDMSALLQDVFASANR